MSKSIVIVGGTGAQGAAVVQTLASEGIYTFKVLTRDVKSTQATTLAALPGVTLIETPGQYEDKVLFDAFKGSDYAFINTDGFSLGEQAETFWGIRMYQLAYEAGISHFVYSGLDSVLKKAKFDSKYRVGHYEGKAKVAGMFEYLANQPTDHMKWTVISSGPYSDNLIEGFCPTVDDDGVYNFNLPLAQGALPLISLDDFGGYVAWAFANPSKSSGLNLEIATAHVSGDDIANAFQAVTGKDTRYNDIPISAWVNAAFGSLPDGLDTKIGFRQTSDQSTLRQTYSENFTGWWHLYQASAGNKGLIQRDYDMLDQILPNRIKSIEEWMRKTAYTGERKQVLKNSGGRR